MNLTQHQHDKVDTLLLDALTKAEPDTIIRVIMKLQPSTHPESKSAQEHPIDPVLFESRQEYRAALIERQKRQTDSEIGETIRALESLSLTVQGGQISRTVVVEGPAQQIAASLNIPGVRWASFNRPLHLIEPTRSTHQPEPPDPPQRADNEEHTL